MFVSTDFPVAVLRAVVEQGAGNMYEIVRYEDALLFVYHPRWGQQLWALGQRKVLKKHSCVLCGRAVEKGSDAMYRPMTNRGNRMERICRPCGEEPACV